MPREAIVAESAYTRNWWSRFRARINGTREGDRGTVQLDTDRDLQIQQPPQHILRIFEDRVGSQAGPPIVQTYPEIAPDIYIPHMSVRRQLATPNIAPKTIANDAYVPAVYVGNPQG